MYKVSSQNLQHRNASALLRDTQQSRLEALQEQVTIDGERVSLQEAIDRTRLQLSRLEGRPGMAAAFHAGRKRLRELRDLQKGQIFTTERFFVNWAAENLPREKFLEGINWDLYI